MNLNMSEIDTNSNNIIFDVSEENFLEKVIENSEDQAVLVDFWAPWCEPCKKLTPVLEEVISECNGKALLAKINIDENQQVAAQLRIQSIPTILAFKNKKINNAFQGVLPKKNIIEFVEKVIGEKINEDNSAFYDEIKNLFEKKQYGNFHIIAGSFRLEENSLKMISKLKSKGFTEARKVGMNKYGLIQVAYNSYKSIREARLALSEIRLDQDSNAWLLIKN